MTIELFKDFIRRAESREPVPEQFSSEAWNGGLPYVGVAHYLDLNGFGIVGDTTQIYVDGAIFKARGTFRDTPMANAAFDAIKRDIAENVPNDQRIRVSIAFIDWSHKHEGHDVFNRKSLFDRCEMCSEGLGEKMYIAGHLVHLALTRRPAYIETEIALEEKSMTDKSTKQARLDDAASIVGDELADKLETKDQELIGRSADGIDPNAIVVKDESESGEEEVTEATSEASVEDGAPLGGAMTLNDAEAYLVRDGQPVLLDSWNVLAGVLTNIAGTEHADAIANELTGFQSKLDIMTMKALTDLQIVNKEAIMADNEEVKGEEEAKPTGTVGDEETTEEAPFEERALAEAIPHPLDEALLAIKAAYDEAVATPIDTPARLRMIQDSVNDLGAAIKGSIGEGATSAPDGGSGVKLDEIQAVVREAIAPLAAEIVALKTRSGAPVTPQRRAITALPASLRAAPVERSEPAPELLPGQVVSARTNQNITPKLREVVKRSVYGPGYDG
jgi:hypothetical protein